MKHTFLHMSNLHYRPNWAEESELVAGEFIEDVVNESKDAEDLYLAFSGDIVFGADDTDSYSKVMERLNDALKSVGLSFERRICCPGNHDIAQGQLKPLLLMQQSTVAAIKDELTFNDQVPQLSQSIFESKFRSYASFEKKFAKYGCCQSGYGGTGWELGNGVGVYCLNTALCSGAGLEDSQGRAISDKDHLLIDTRSLQKWLAETDLTCRILVMHHPTEWLSEWAKIELEKIIAKKFQLVFCGHTHKDVAEFSSRGAGGAVSCAAPALFTRKSDTLGYAFVSVDTDSGAIEIKYRQWCGKDRFVAGTGLAGNDQGRLLFHRAEVDRLVEVVGPTPRQKGNTLSLLQAEFDEAVTCYASKKRIWVDRDLADMPETARERENAIMAKSSDLYHNFRSCIIRAPKQFGLTCLGRAIALEHYRKNGERAIVMVDTPAVPAHRRGVIDHMSQRCEEINIEKGALGGVILDNWRGDKQSRRVLHEIETEFPDVPVMLLQSSDDCADISNTIELENIGEFEILYLWALTRTRIRELVVAYTRDMTSLDEDLVTKKVIEDIDALNIHRTPLNCLLILKLAEQAFDDSPVNRTEMIGRVLYLLFYQYDKIPRYATRPDLKDCEYALGYLCEWLIRSGRNSFTKNEFYAKVNEYCETQILDLDCEVLFAFLVTENIVVRRGLEFAFRFNYWLYYFAAHRMHHNPGFAEYILGERRYSAYPEVIEFYTGIDRRRSDAIERLTADLKAMNSDFSKRTGIPEEFNPFDYALWNPSNESLEEMKRLVGSSVAESTLPTAVKDGIADRSYDRARPYNQELARFIDESSLAQMVSAMRGAARALRNSDHVLPEAKMKLLKEVQGCWHRVCQILVFLSWALAEHRRAQFEGMGFFLEKSFDDYETTDKRWNVIMNVIAENVVDWYQEDIFSKKMGALFSKHIAENQGQLSEFLILLVMAKQRPPRWEKEVEKFIVRSKKNSFYLSRIHALLRAEYRIGFSNEQTRQQLRRLAAMSAAKHLTGSKKPNKKLVERAAEVIDLDSNGSRKPRIGGKLPKTAKVKKSRRKRRKKGGRWR